MCKQNCANHEGFEKKLNRWSFWPRPWSYASAKSNHPKEPPPKEELPTGCAPLRRVAASKQWLLTKRQTWKHLCKWKKKGAWKCHSHRSSTGLCPWNQVWMQRNLAAMVSMNPKSELVNWYGQPTYFSSPWLDQKQFYWISPWHVWCCSQFLPQFPKFIRKLHRVTLLQNDMMVK